VVRQGLKAGKAVDATVMDAFTSFDEKLMDYLQKLRTCIPRTHLHRDKQRSAYRRRKPLETAG
jgi:hypothetical protein